MLEHEPGTTAPSVADLYEKGVSSGSMSKSYSLAGLRTGWVAGPARGHRALPRRARLHDDQRRRARRRPRRRGARARGRGARAQPRDRARQPGGRRRVDRAGAAAALRAAARRHHRARPLRLRPALGRLLPGHVRLQRRLRHAGRRLRRGARLPPRLRVRPRRARGRARGRVRRICARWTRMAEMDRAADTRGSARRSRRRGGRCWPRNARIWPGCAPASARSVSPSPSAACCRRSSTPRTSPSGCSEPATPSSASSCSSWRPTAPSGPVRRWPPNRPLPTDFWAIWVLTGVSIVLAVATIVLVVAEV